jgi:exodeoxyribonuclease VII large subunit
MQGDMAETSVVKALAMIALREDEFDVVTIIRGGGSVSDLALFDSYLIASHVAQFPLPVITGIGHDKDVSVTDMVAHTMCKTPTAVATRLIELVDEEMEYLLRAEAEVTIYAEQLLNNYNSTLALRERDLFALSNELLMTHEHHVESLYRSIVEQAQQLVEGQREYLTQAEHFVDSHSLDNILRLGFAVLHGEVSPGERITIERLDDIITAEIINVEQR